MEAEYMPEQSRLHDNHSEETNKRGHDGNQENPDQHVIQIGNEKPNLPKEEFNGFSTEEMFEMENRPLEPGCPVQLRELTEEELSQVPIVRQALHLMNALSEKDLRLTKKGSLPMKMVSELYSLGNHDMTIGLYPQMTEDSNPDIMALRRILRETGLVKTKAGKLSLTIKGGKYLKGNHNEMLRNILLYLFTKYNTGWYDLQRGYEIGNQGRLYTLWLLHHFGEEWRLMDFYKEEYFKAFPQLFHLKGLQEEPIVPSKFYTYRVFQNLFAIIGVCEIDENKWPTWDNSGIEVRKSPILDMMFSFEEPGEI